MKTMFDFFAVTICNSHPVVFILLYFLMLIPRSLSTFVFAYPTWTSMCLFYVPIIFLRKQGIWATDWTLFSCMLYNGEEVLTVFSFSTCDWLCVEFWWRKDNQLAPIWAKIQGTKVAACTIFVNWYKHSNRAVLKSLWESALFFIFC